MPIDLLATVSLTDFVSDAWRLLATFGLLFGWLGLWYWLLTRLGTF